MTRSVPFDPSDAAQPQLSRALTFILALACGIAAANIYYVQPLIGLISRDYGMPAASAGLLVTVTQIGYAAGLLLVVPLGDILENRKLIAGLLGLLVIALIALALAPNAGSFLIVSIFVGLGASTVQIIVPFAGHLAPDASRGQTVGNVVSGLLFGIMLSRPAASFAAHFGGHHLIFELSAAVTAGLALLMLRTLPDRRPHGMPYVKAIASLWPLLRNTNVLQRRGAYQAALFGCFSLFWTAVPLLLESPRFGFNQVGIGLFALAGAAGAVVSPFAGRAADQGKTRLVTLLSLTGAALAFVVALLGGLFTSWPLLVIAALLIDMAAAGNLVVGQRAIFAIGAETRGRLNGLYLALFFLGGSFGAFVAGYALAAGGWTAVSLVGMVFPLIGLAYFTTESRTAYTTPL